MICCEENCDSSAACAQNGGCLEDEPEKRKDLQEHPVRLPGLPGVKETKFDGNIKETIFYEKVLGCGGQRNFKLKLLMTFQLAEYMTAQYLPKNFHVMEFKNESSATGILSELKQASFYLLSIHLCRALQPRQLFKLHEAQKKNLLTSLRLLVEHADINLLREPIYANDILQDPMIFIQVPFQVGLMYPMMIASLNENNKLAVELIEYSAFAFPDNISELYLKLHGLNSQFNHRAGYYAELMTHTFKATLNSEFEVNVKTGLFQQGINALLFEKVLFEFIFNGTSSNIAKALRRHILATPGGQRTLTHSDQVVTCSRLKNLESDFPNIEEYGMHRLQYWRYECPEQRTSRCCEHNHQDEIFRCHKQFSNEYFDQSIIDTIEECLIKPGIITGVTIEDLINVLSQDIRQYWFQAAAMMHTIREYLWYKELCEGVENSGIIYSITCNSEAKKNVANLLTETCKLIVAVTAKSPKKAVFHPPDCDGPDITITQIDHEMDKIAKVLKPAKLSSIKKTLRKTLAHVQFPEQTLEEVPNVELLGIEKTTQIFEAALKHRVFETYKGYYSVIVQKTKGDSDTAVPEKCFSPKLLIVQYVFPHFVRLLRTMVEAPIVEQKKYVLFLHQLLTSSEYIPSETDSYETPWPYPKTVDGILLQISKEFQTDKIDLASKMCSKLFPAKVSEILVGYFDFLKESLNIPYEGSYLNETIPVWNVQITKFLRVALSSLKFTCDSFDCRDELDTLNSLPRITISLLEVACVYPFFCAKKKVPPLFENDFVDQVMRDLNENNEKIIYRSRTNMKLSYSVHQVFGVLMYIALTQAFENETDHCPALSCFPLVKHIFESYRKGDSWRAKLDLALLVNDERREDMSLYNPNTANFWGPLYKEILRSSTVKEATHKVKMSKPGEITFFPVKHCRWCGRIDCHEFKICHECAIDCDYPDVNFFCSTKCEKEAMMSSHQEEHERFLIEQCKF